MALLAQVKIVNESGGATLLEVSGIYSLPTLNEFIWLGEEGSLVEYKVESLDHYYTTKDITNPTSGGVEMTINAKVTITVSVVTP